MHSVTPGSVQQFGHEARGPVHMTQGFTNFIDRQYDGQSTPRLDSSKAAQMPDLDLEHIVIQKQERVQRLRLRRSRYFAIGGQVIDESNDTRGADIAWMALVVKQDVAAGPESVRFFRAPAQMPPSAQHGKLVHETWRCIWWGEITP
jgi:hypothetical protein